MPLTKLTFCRIIDEAAVSVKPTMGNAALELSVMRSVLETPVIRRVRPFFAISNIVAAPERVMVSKTADAVILMLVA